MKLLPGTAAPAAPQGTALSSPSLQFLGLGPPHGPFSMNHSHESSSCHNPEWKRPEKGQGRTQASLNLLRSGPRQGECVAAERREGALQMAGTGGGEGGV